MDDILPYNQAKDAITIKEKVGQFFMPAAFINDTEEEIKKTENLITRFHIGSICFFHSRASAATNYEGKKEVLYNARSLHKLKELIKRYQSASKYPLLIAIDAEWGLAMRIEETPQYPYALTLGAIHDYNLIQKVGESIGQDCKNAGIHWNLCPSVDINNNPNNPVIGYRSFGDNPKDVYQKSKAFIEGMSKSGILNSIKHFPGHGDTETDSHLGLPRIEKSKHELLQNELYPFKNLIKYGIDSVMVGHLAVPSIGMHKTKSSTVSKPIITELLRNEFGHSGVIISDALNMHSVSKLHKEKGQLEFEAFEAGNDVLCFAENTEEGISKIYEKISTQRIEKSFRRIWELKEKAFSFTKELTPHSYDNLMLELAKNTITFFKGSKIELKTFFESGFDLIEIGNQKKSIFASLLEIEKNIKNKKVIAIFPREMKPINNFGLTNKEINYTNKLLENEECIIYLFGNPYSLNLFKHNKAKAIVLVYQDFEIFQKNAANHLQGNVLAKGILPVKL